MRDPRLDGMPRAPVRVAVPTTLAGDLIERVVAGVADQVTLELRNIRVRAPAPCAGSSRSAPTTCP